MLASSEGLASLCACSFTDRSRLPSEDPEGQSLGRWEVCLGLSVTVGSVLKGPSSFFLVAHISPGISLP